MTRRTRAWLLTLTFVSGCATVHQTERPADAAKDFGPDVHRPAPLAPGLGFLNPLEMPRPEVEHRCHALSAQQRENTHLFVINGLDPLYWSNLNSAIEYLRTMGFKNAKCLQIYEAGIFRKEIAELRKREPNARIALAGYSSGANCARSMANQLAEDRVELDLLIYIGGDTIFNTRDSRPANVRRILNIRSNGLWLTGHNMFFNGDDLEGASNHWVNCRHIVLPARRQTVELMVSHLVDLWSDSRSSFFVELGTPQPLGP